MTVLAAALSALALATAADATATPRPAQAARTQAAPAAAPAAPQAAAARPPMGVSAAGVIGWLGAQGLSVGALQQDEDGRQYVRVQGDGLVWLLFLQSCENGLCSDAQFSTAVTNAAVTPTMVNDWNRDRRFLKAIYEAPEGTNPASAVVQYDVILYSGGPEQLADHLSVWRSLLPQFARLATGAPPAAPAPAPAAQ